MGWEIFSKESRARTANPMLTIGQKLGRCTLNRPAAEKFKEEGVDLVLLMWDKESLTWGIRPITKKDDRAFSIRYSQTKDKEKAITGGAFAGVTFLRHIGYDYSTTEQFTIAWDADQAIFTVQLPKERFNSQQERLKAVEGGKGKHGKALAGD